ncbi:MAG: DUF6385 domain-containing protein [Clostridia bacterium]|nr:DUF6385 domain-containing protein [Clostridia bacterium]
MTNPTKARQKKPSPKKKPSPQTHVIKIVSSRKFTSLLQSDLITANSNKYSQAWDVSEMSRATFLVINHGRRNSAEVGLEISPGKGYWLNDGAPVITIPPQGHAVLVANYFLHYARVHYRSLIPNRPTRLSIWYQGQK